MAQIAREADVSRQAVYKRLARIEAVGYRINGNRSKGKRGVGDEIAFVCVDDPTRSAYAEVLPSESGRHAAAFSLFCHARETFSAAC